MEPTKRFFTPAEELKAGISLPIDLLLGLNLNDLLTKRLLYKLRIFSALREAECFDPHKLNFKM